MSPGRAHADELARQIAELRAERDLLTELVATKQAILVDLEARIADLTRVRDQAIEDARVPPSLEVDLGAIVREAVAQALCAAPPAPRSRQARQRKASR